MNGRASREARKAASEAAGAVKSDVGEALGKALEYMRGVEQQAQGAALMAEHAEKRSVSAAASASALGKRVAALEAHTTLRERLRWLLRG